MSVADLVLLVLILFFVQLLRHAREFGFLGGAETLANVVATLVLQPILVPLLALTIVDAPGAFRLADVCGFTSMVRCCCCS